MKSKQNSAPMYTAWALGIVLCILLSVFALLFSSCSPSQGTEPSESPTISDSADESEAPTVSDTSVTEPAESAAVPSASSHILGETEDAGQEYIDSMVFLGDSTTYGLKHYGVLSGGTETQQVWTPASGTLTLYFHDEATIIYPETGEEITIVDALSRSQPEYLVITLGVNGVSMMDEAYFTEEYTELVNNVKATSPDTKIILNSIYPVEADYQYVDQINKDNISAANTWIQNVAESTGTKYTDSASVLTGSDGWLIEEYGNGDGIHLSAIGFEQVLLYLRTHAYQ